MRDIFGSFVIAFSMYSRIPMPQVEWTRERMRYAMCFFPLIGVVIGAAQLALYYLLSPENSFLAASFRESDISLRVIRTVLGLALPLLITGGIHMDGFLDGADARHSYGSREKKLTILSDPHVGAFAVIGFGVYLLIYGAGFFVLSFAQIRILALVYVWERALSGLSVVTFPMAKQDGLAAQFSKAAVKKTVRLVMLFYLLTGGVLLFRTAPWPGLFCMAVMAGTFAAYYRRSVTEFGGITGDLAGHFLQCCERNAVLALAFCGLFGI